MKRIFLLLLVLYTTCIVPIKADISTEQRDSSAVFRIVSYNVENLFHPDYDSINPDRDFTTDGAHRWTYGKYRNKIENIAQVLTDISPWNTPDIVGLYEIENRQCMDDLNNVLRRFEYKIIHYDSPDPRGIDVAILYRPTFQLLQSYPIRIDMDGTHTRDIVYMSGLVYTGDTLHMFFCHLPSQATGTAETEWKRKHVKNVLQQRIDFIYSISQHAQIIVAGDMNSEPKDDLKGMKNLMLPYIRTAVGTYKHKGKWSCLDQFYISDTFKYRTSVTIYSPTWLLEDDERYLGLKPKRTFVGYRYQNGYSDHLPILLEISR